MKNMINIKIKSANFKIIVGAVGILGIILFFLKIIVGYVNTANETLAIGDEVIVQNAVAGDGGEGVRLQANPGTGSPCKGWVFNGATGTVIKGPKDEGDHRWWKVLWDAGQGTDKIRWNPRHPCDAPPCEVWVAEVINDFVVLAEKN